VPLVVLAALAVIDWPSAAIVALCLPLAPLFMVLIGRYTRDQTLATVRALGRISTHITELVRGLPVLVGLGRAGERLAQLRRLSRDNRQEAMRTLRTAFLSAAVLELLATLSMALVAVTAGLRLVNGSAPLATGLAALLLAPEVFVALRMLGAAYHSADDAVEAVTRTQELTSRPEPSPVLASSKEDGYRGLRLDELSVRYAGRAAPAVPSLTASIEPGESVLLTGASGAGKSTVLDVIAGRLRPGSTAKITGEVRGAGARVGHVPQHPRWAAATVDEELRLHGASEVAQALAEVGLDPGVARRPCADLSPGEQQLVAFARALAQVRLGARVLLLDEPTAHVDSERSRAVARLVESLRGTVTVLAATHDPVLAAVTDRKVSVR
jgi:ATP-binding cassette subfamily C protein CydCD